MTGAAPASNHVDPAQLVDATVAVLAQRHSITPTVVDVRPMEPGHDATVLAVTLSGAGLPNAGSPTVVFRALPASRLDHARWEQAAHRHLSRHGVEVPEIFDVVAVGDHAVQVMSVVPGDSMALCMARRPWATRRCAHAMAVLLAALHDVPTDGFPEHPTAPLLERRLDVADRVPVEVQHCAESVRARLKDGPDTVVVHGDLHPQNIIIESPERCAAIDWTDAGLAAPEADLARLETALQLAAVGAPTPLQRRAVSLITERFPRRVRELYQAFTGRTLDDGRLDAWRTAHRLHDLGQLAARDHQTERIQAIRTHLLTQLTHHGGAG